MNILFLSLSDYKTITFHGLYSDLLRQFIKNGDNIYMISPIEQKKKEKNRIIKETGCTILKLVIGNTQKTNVIEKGISIITIEHIFIAGIKKYFNDIKFDLVLYTTPPITFCKVVDYVKTRDCARSYLLLKDIFPQNAVDIGMMKKDGIKGIIYRYFRLKEKKLYKISDYIGCMSKANVDYFRKHNPEVPLWKTHICPNSCDPIDMSSSSEERKAIRNKYGIPQDKIVFVYGGNIGKPQGIDFMVKCIHSQRRSSKIFFLIVGNGTEFEKIEKYIELYKPSNIRLMEQMPKEDYERMIGSCDVGLIFLDYRFTIPNFPCRMLAYMQAKIPVLAVTDTATDIGKVIVDGKFGWWCESNDVEKFKITINTIIDENKQRLGKNGFDFLEKNYSSVNSYRIIMSCLRRDNNEEIINHSISYIKK